MRSKMLGQMSAKARVVAGATSDRRASLKHEAISPTADHEGSLCPSSRDMIDKEGIVCHVLVVVLQW
jgi:hypothetical protein